jgi:hypothetical protein
MYGRFECPYLLDACFSRSSMVRFRSGFGYGDPTLFIYPTVGMHTWCLSWAARSLLRATTSSSVTKSLEGIDA